MFEALRVAWHWDNNPLPVGSLNVDYPRERFVFIEATKPKAPRAPRKRLDVSGTLADLLAQLEENFELVQLPTAVSMTSADTITGLRKMGPWVPWGPYVPRDDPRVHIKSQYLNRWPTLIFISRGTLIDRPEGYVDGKDWISTIAFIYAVRLKKVPWHVEQTTAVCYEFGMAFRFKQKLQWITGYVAINRVSGAVTLRQQLVVDHHTLRTGKNRGWSYPHRHWTQPMIENATLWGETMAERQDKVTHAFVHTFEWWQRRDDRWVVSVRRDTRRVTFSVEQELTKHFFKNREITALTPTGQRKRIIHHVDAHTRLLASGNEAKVREHIRGERMFNWNGFACAVTAPAFHAYTLQSFNVDAFEEDDVPTKTKMLPLSEVGGKLGKLEDLQKRGPKF